LWIDTTINISDNTTLPAGTHVIVVQPGNFVVATSKTLTLAGSMQLDGTISGAGSFATASTGKLSFQSGTISTAGAVTLGGTTDMAGGVINTAGNITIGKPISGALYQWFTGAGAVTIATGAIPAAYPEWFGITGSNDQVAINKALNAYSRVIQNSNYLIGDCILVPSNTSFVNGGSYTITVDATGAWTNGNSGTRPAVRNKDGMTGNVGIRIESLRIIGVVSSGSEWDHGILLTKTIDSWVLNNDIYQVNGSGVFLGNLVGGTAGTGICENVIIQGNVIDTARQMGIALTQATKCTVANNIIRNLTDHDGGGYAAAIDLEPDMIGDTCSLNIVTGNQIYNCAKGISLASVAAMAASTVYGNQIINNNINTITAGLTSGTGHGIFIGYSGTVAANNIIANVQKNGIYVVNTAGITDVTVSGNIINGSGGAAASTYYGIYLAVAAQCTVTNNVIAAGGNTLAKAFAEDANSGYNIYLGNNIYNTNQAYSIQALSNASHNIQTPGGGGPNYHEAFSAIGNIDMVGNSIKFNGMTLMMADGVPGAATGATGDMYVDIGAVSGEKLIYKKVSAGTWKALDVNIAA